MTEILTVYFAVVNVIGAIVAVYDKSISKLPRGSIRRVPEKRFVQFALLGGGVGTLFAFGLVRHKTKHTALLWQVLLPTVAWIAAWLWMLR